MKRKKETNLTDLPKGVLNIILFDVAILHPKEILMMMTMCKKLNTCLTHEKYIIVKTAKIFGISEQFKNASFFGDLKTMKWLWNVAQDEIDIHADEKFSFRMAHLLGRPDIGRWLLRISHHIIDEEVVAKNLIEWLKVL